MSVIRKTSHDSDVQVIDAADGEKKQVDEIDHDAENMILLGIRAPKFVKERKRCILYPDDTFYIYWDMFMSFILLISCLITPLNFAFSRELEAI